jgi:hypothetical protein
MHAHKRADSSHASTAVTHIDDRLVASSPVKHATAAVRHAAATQHHIGLWQDSVTQAASGGGGHFAGACCAQFDVEICTVRNLIMRFVLMDVCVYKHIQHEFSMR